VTDELRALISRKNKYHIVFPAAVLFMAQADGKIVAKEKEFYKAVLSRLSLDDYEQEDFQKLLSSHENIIEAILEIEEISMRENLVKVMALMAVYDGELASEERELLINVAGKLNVTLDIAAVEAQTQEYRIIIKENVFKKIFRRNS
jgi:tellurite resistance protein